MVTPVTLTPSDSPEWVERHLAEAVTRYERDGSDAHRDALAARWTEVADYLTAYQVPGIERIETDQWAGLIVRLDDLDDPVHGTRRVSPLRIVADVDDLHSYVGLVIEPYTEHGMDLSSAHRIVVECRLPDLDLLLPLVVAVRRRRGIAVAPEPAGPATVTAAAEQHRALADLAKAAEGRRDDLIRRALAAQPRSGAELARAAGFAAPSRVYQIRDRRR